MIPRIDLDLDPAEFRALADRIRAGQRALIDPERDRELADFLEAENERLALAGLDKNEQPLRPWARRSGRSDYHGGAYAAWTSGVPLAPFGKRSRRRAAFGVRRERDGDDRTTLLGGFDPRAGRVPLYWKQQGRDVLGLSPGQRRGAERILRRHTAGALGLLREGGRSPGV